MFNDRYDILGMAVDLALNVYFWIVVRQFYSKDMAAIPLTNRGTV